MLLLNLLILLTLSCCHDGEEITLQPLAFNEDKEMSSKDSVLFEEAVIDNRLYNKAVTFRDAAHTDEKSMAVYVYQTRSAVKYKDDPEKLAARLALLGFTDVYFGTNNNALKGIDAANFAWMKKFNAALHKYEVKSHAMRFVGTHLYVDMTKAALDAESIKFFNRNAAENERFDGANADLEPHMLRQGGPDTPSGLDIFWESGYGIGNSNDRLLGRTLDILEYSRNELEGMPLSQAIGFFWQSRYDNGELSNGSATDFLRSCKPLIIMSYYKTKEGIWSRTLPIFNNAANEKESIYLAIKTSVSTYGNDDDAVTSLQPQGWKYLLESLDYFYTQSQNYPAYKGVCIFEFEGLEKMWEWQNDKE